MFGLFEWEDLETRLILFIINPECELEKKNGREKLQFYFHLIKIANENVSAAALPNLMQQKRPSERTRLDSLQ